MICMVYWPWGGKFHPPSPPLNDIVKISFLCILILLVKKHLE